MNIQPLQWEDPQLQNFMEESTREGHRFVARMLQEYTDGTMTFQEEGELMLAAKRDDRIIGVCGLSRDPYVQQTHTGRVRHLYVEQVQRRSGVARKLLEAILAEAEKHYELLTLYTDLPAAARLYESAGFLPCSHIQKATHMFYLKKEQAG